MTSKFRIVLLVAAVAVIAGCTAGQVRKNLDKTDQAIEQLDKTKAAADQTVAAIEPVFNILPEEQKAKAKEALEQARAFLATYDQTRAAYVATRDELLEKLKDAKDEDSATWATIGTVAANAVGAVFSPGGLLATGIALVTGIAGLFKGKQVGVAQGTATAQADAKTIVNAVDALRARVPAVAEAMKTNKDIFVSTLSPKAWDLVEAERTT